MYAGCAGKGSDRARRRSEGERHARDERAAGGRRRPPDRVRRASPPPTRGAGPRRAARSRRRGSRRRACGRRRRRRRCSGCSTPKWREEPAAFVERQVGVELGVEPSGPAAEVVGCEVEARAPALAEQARVRLGEVVARNAGEVGSVETELDARARERPASTSRRSRAAACSCRCPVSFAPRRRGARVPALGRVVVERQAQARLRVAQRYAAIAIVGIDADRRAELGVAGRGQGERRRRRRRAPGPSARRGRAGARQGRVIAAASVGARWRRRAPRRRAAGWRRHRRDHRRRTHERGARPVRAAAFALACASSISASRPLTCAAAYDAPDTVAQREPGSVVGMSVPGAATMPARRRARGLVDDGDDAAHGGRKATLGQRAVGGSDDADAALERRARSSCSMQPVGRPAQAQVDDLRASVDRRVQRRAPGSASCTSVSAGAAWRQARSARRRARGATPAMPTWLSARAAMMPATAVPWISAASVADRR